MKKEETEVKTTTTEKTVIQSSVVKKEKASTTAVVKTGTAKTTQPIKTTTSGFVSTRPREISLIDLRNHGFIVRGGKEGSFTIRDVRLDGTGLVDLQVSGGNIRVFSKNGTELKNVHGHLDIEKKRYVRD